MKKHYRALTKGEIAEALSYLPLNHKDLVKDRVRPYNQRKKNRKGQVVEGSYLSKEGSIVVYAFSSEEILTKRYLNTIWHEVGHKIFHEILARRDKVLWGTLREKEDFLIDLSDLYTFKELWEEEFCFTYQMLVRLNFYRTNDMKKKAKKLEKTLDAIPKRKEFVKKLFSQTRSLSSHKPAEGNCLKLAQDRLEKTIGPLI